MKISLIVYFTLIGIALLISAHEHGTPKEGKNSFWNTLVSVILSIVMIMWIAEWSIN